MYLHKSVIIWDSKMLYKILKDYSFFAVELPSVYISFEVQPKHWQSH